MNTQDLPEAPSKLICLECGWAGREEDVLTAPNPFRPDETIYGCPKCREANQITQGCQIGDCAERPSAGTPGGYGYRYVWTCWDHHPPLKIGEAG